VTATAGGFALELREVRKAFGPTDVLRGVSLALAPDERVALIGPNGAGKSTLFDVVSGRTACGSGAVLLHGRRIDGLPPHRISRLGLARSFQASSVFDGLSVFDNLRCAALWSLGQRYVFWRSLGSLASASRRAEELLCLLGLEHRRGVPARALGHAEQRALELGLALAGDPRVVLLDEPSAGLGPAEAARFAEVIRVATQGRTLLMVEHDMGAVFGLADRVAVLVQGVVIAFDTPERVRADARVQAAYLGAVPLESAGFRCST
jgi:branched-chain amino acid transport system ATP-binding protein